MSTNVICSIVTAIGVVLSALISWAVAKSAANKEIDKMKLTWEREDVVSSDDEFAEMASAVSIFVASDTGANYRTAMQKIAAVRSKEHGPVATYLDALYVAVREKDWENIDDLLTQVIEEKRKAKCYK